MLSYVGVKPKPNKFYQHQLIFVPNVLDFRYSHPVTGIYNIYVDISKMTRANMKMLKMNNWIDRSQSDGPAIM